jgi:hypothetical protein
VSEPARSSASLRWARYGAWLTLSGALLSGPLSLLLVNATHPQPEWRDAASFVRHFHPLQTLPFFLGFALVGGLLTLVVSLSELCPLELRARSKLASALAVAFAALVFLNYAVQTTFVPLLVDRFRDSDGPVLSAFTMANPKSLGWCIEMWAYAVAGVATWLVAPVFAGGGLARATRVTFVANGPTSVASALATALVPGWALTTPGLVAFIVWNGLVVAMSVLALLSLAQRERSAPAGPASLDDAARA